MIGEVIGNYRILERIDNGGMGQVFRGEEILLGREVVIKTLRPQLLQEPDILERFQQEAMILAKLQHPNIVKLYSFFRDGDRCLIIMEYVSGQSLAALMPCYPDGMPWRQAVMLISQVLAALDYAHSRDIVHRDIKPSNLMVEGDRMLKVTDFGMARVLGSSQFTRIGAMAGTLKYMSPEQIQSREVDGRSDLYSTALVLYELLCGRAPFDEPSEYELIKAQVEMPPPSLLEKLPGIPPRLEYLVMRALAKNPQDRYTSAWEFQQLLENVLRDEDPGVYDARFRGCNGSSEIGSSLKDLLPPSSGKVEMPRGLFTERLAAAGTPGSGKAETISSIPKPTSRTAWLSRAWVLVGLGVGIVAILVAGLMLKQKWQKWSQLARNWAAEIQERQVIAGTAINSAEQTEIVHLQAQISATRTLVEESQKQLHEQVLSAARDVQRFAEWAKAAPKGELRLSLQTSELEAEDRFDRLTELETQYHQLLQETDGVIALEKASDSALHSLEAGQVAEARQGLQQTLSAWQRIRDYPKLAQESWPTADSALIGQLDGRWGDQGCTLVSTWQVKDRAVTVSWQDKETADVRVVALKKAQIYAVINTPASHHGEIYRYQSDGQTLRVENLTDGRARTLKRC